MTLKGKVVLNLVNVCPRLVSILLRISAKWTSEIHHSIGLLLEQRKSRGYLADKLVIGEYRHYKVIISHFIIKGKH